MRDDSMNRLGNRTWTIASAIVLLVAGVSLLSPVRIGVMVSEERHSFVADPNVLFPQLEQVPIVIPHGQYAQITVQYEENASWVYSWVRLDVEYTYPTKFISEGMQYEVENEVQLLLGWEDARLIRVFITGFQVALIFQAEEAASVNLTIAKMVSVGYWTGMAALVLSVPLLWCAHVRDHTAIGRRSRLCVLAYILILVSATIVYRAYVETIIPAVTLIAVLAAKRNATDLGNHPKGPV